MANLLSSDLDNGRPPWSPVTPGQARLAGFGGREIPEDLDRVGHGVDPRHAIDASQAGVALFKAIVGPGILFLPSAVKNAGLISAACVGAIVGSISAWSMLRLLDCSEKLRKCGYTISSVGDVGQAAFGTCGRLAVESTVVISQLGFCTAYCVFVAENVQSIVFELHGGMPGVEGEGQPCALPGFLSDRKLLYYIILIVILPLTPLTWVRQLRYFAISNIIASLLVILSVAFLMITFAWELHQHGVAQNLNFSQTSGTMVFIGTAMYAWEGIGVLLPIERAMAKPSQLRCVVCLTMLVVCLVQVCFASMAYSLYGEDTAAIVTVSLVHKEEELT